MPFETYADNPPVSVGEVKIELTYSAADGAGGTYAFPLLDTDGQIVEWRKGDLADVVTQLNTTSITVPQLVAWMPQLFALAETVLPTP